MKQEHLASLPTKEAGFNILYIPFLFISNQFISKQSSHVQLLMLTQAHRNRAAGSEFIDLFLFLFNLSLKLTERQDISYNIPTQKIAVHKKNAN